MPQYSYSFFTCFCNESPYTHKRISKNNFFKLSSFLLERIATHYTQQVEGQNILLSTLLIPLRCILQCQGCKANKRSVYANPSTYILCLHMRALYDLTGWHAWALASLLWLTICPGNRPYILLRDPRFSTGTNLWQCSL